MGVRSRWLQVIGRGSREFGTPSGVAARITSELLTEAASALRRHAQQLEAVVTADDAIRPLDEAFRFAIQRPRICSSTWDNWMLEVAECLDAHGRHAEAVSITRYCFEKLQEALPNHHQRVAYARAVLGTVLVAGGEAGTLAVDSSAAERLLLDSLHPTEPLSESRPRRTRDRINRLIRLYDAWGKRGQADAYRAKLHKVP